MYKMLLVSDKQEIRELYVRFPEWETLGFERPSIAKSAGEMGRFMTYSWFIFENASTTNPGTIISVTTMGVFFTIVNLPLMIAARVLTKKFTPEY